jgi:ribonucleoside-diphosphate reductase alpha chain
MTVSAIHGIALKKFMNKVQKRDGSLSDFDAAKIEAAIIQAVLRDQHGTYRQGRTLSASQRAVTELVTQAVVTTLNSRVTDGVIHIEDIQDQVELALMRAGEHVVARDYVLYREARAAERQRPVVDEVDGVDTDAGHVQFCDIRTEIYSAVAHLPVKESLSQAIFSEARKALYDGMPKSEIITAAIMAARSLIELDPDYSRAAAALLMTKIRGEATGACLGYSVGLHYKDYFPAYIARGIAVGRLDPRLAEFDLAHLGSVIIRPERDLDIDYLGLQILYDRYLIHDREVRIETPQAMWMRVAMGIALAEDANRTEWAAKFYQNAP